jgi:hypothetical protein
MMQTRFVQAAWEALSVGVAPEGVDVLGRPMESVMPWLHLLIRVS